MLTRDGDGGQRAAKVGSTKSRAGCSTCRQRRVRCDQARPACANCTRLGLDCAYNPQPSRSNRVDFKAYEPDPPRQSTSVPLQASSNTQTGETAIPESEERRLLELRLLHHWLTVVSRPFPSTPAPRWGELWRVDLPLIALRSRGVLYALMAMSATHLLRTTATESGDYEKLSHARNQYFAHALAQQRTAVENLDVANIDEVSFSALLISLNAFSMLRERRLDPYTPPMDWLEMGYGAGVVMRQAAEFLDETSPSKTKEIIETTLPIHQNFEPQTMNEEEVQPYEALLQRLTDNEDDSMNGEESEACVQAVKTVAQLRRAVQAGEPEYVHLRRICMFPFMVPAKFIDLVRERRPAALVVLAHLFAAIANTQALAYLGNTGKDLTTSRREVIAVRRYVPEDWHGRLIWPMDEVRAEL